MPLPDFALVPSWLSKASKASSSRLLAGPCEVVACASADVSVAVITPFREFYEIHINIVKLGVSEQRCAVRGSNPTYAILFWLLF